MKKIISIGTNVTVNNILQGMVISVSLRKNSITYEVQITEEDNMKTFWANDWEITSNHKYETILESVTSNG